MTRKVLGRGLSALISDEEQKRDYIDQLDVGRIKPNRYQPREEFNKEKLNELISSIKEKGVVQPILVRPSGNDYELIAGERRLRAVKSIGYTQIPAMIKDVDDMNAIELALIENIQREELNPIEEARAYQRLLDEFSFTQEMVGQAVGKDRATVANSLRLLALPKKIQEFLSKTMITAGHAKVLLSLSSAEKQIELSKKVINKGLSVRALEKLVTKKKTAKRTAFTEDSNMRSIEERIQERLGTKVRINHGKKRGTIQIEYYSNEDLERILRVLNCI
ncbi:MAG: ParB/RepB/Spo0J family partition protein [Candidatus Omnitrophica bacterium]|nr:ParB/RepB/Spo0J family partition protein [Candidatus Omnitrophota bacterium]